MRRSMIGQFLLIVCCMFYLIWWYRGYRPGTAVNRIGGLNGALLLLTMAFGAAGVLLSLTRLQAVTEPKIPPAMIIPAGIAAYAALFLITKVFFQRIVTTELFLIVAWTMLELAVINRLLTGGFLTDLGFVILCIVIAVAFLISIVLYVAYYRMEELHAFYAAMVPLATEAAAMDAIILITLRGYRG